MKSTIRVVIVEDEAVIREALCFLVASFGFMEVVGQAADGREAVTTVECTSPDVVLMDLCMPVMDGMEATRAIKKIRPKTKVLALTGLSAGTEILAGLAAGIDGCVLKRTSHRELQRAIETVFTGRRFLCTEVRECLAKAYLSEQERTSSPLEAITVREQEVLELVCAGMRAKEIAAKLGVSVRTVEKHRDSLRLKCRAETTAELAVIYLKWKKQGN